MNDLKRKSVRGGAVTFLSQGATIGIQLASTVVLARLLSPSDYGLIAMVTSITAFAGLFRDLGLSSAAIQTKNLTRAQQSNLFWLNVTMGTMLTAIVGIASPLVAWFYGQPELLPVTLTLSIGFLISSIGSQHSALLVRNMQLVRQAVAGISGALVSLGITICLAINDWAYWSLVWGGLAGMTTTTFLLVSLSPFRVGLPSRGTGIREMLNLGANVTAFDFVNYFHRNLDNLLIGKSCGITALGSYSRAYSLLMLPINSIRSPINTVGFPALSRLQDRPQDFRHYYLQIARLVALASMPFTAFLFVTAKPVIEIALGAQWTGIAPIFAILSTVGFMQPTITLWGMVVLSRGMGRRYLHLGIFNTICSAMGFLAGLPWGPEGVAAGYATVTYLTAYPILRWAFLGTPLSFSDFIEAISRPFFGSISAVFLCLITSRSINNLPPFLWICASASIFALTFFSVLRLLPGGKSDFTLILNLLSPLSRRIRIILTSHSRT